MTYSAISAENAGAGQMAFDLGFRPLQKKNSPRKSGAAFPLRLTCEGRPTKNAIKSEWGGFAPGGDRAWFGFERGRL